MPRTPPPAQQELLDRLRELLAGRPVTREVSMFGGRCVLVSGKIAVSAGRDGSLGGTPCARPGRLTRPPHPARAGGVCTLRGRTV